MFEYAVRVKELYQTDNSIAIDLIRSKEYPWEILPLIEDYIMQIGPTLDPEKFECIHGDIWVAKSADIADTAYICGPCIIDEDAEIRHCAYIRGKAIVGKGCVVGNSTELKNVILFDGVQVPHYNYVGDSILGYKAHMGAGSITSNVKSDKKDVIVRIYSDHVETGLRKVGAMLGDHVEIGCNTVLNPGTIIGRNTNVYPLSSVRGYVCNDSIYKDAKNIELKTDSIGNKEEFR